MNQTNSDESLKPKGRRRRFRGFELRKALFILPNAFTLASIFCGLYAILHGASAESGDGEALYRSAMAVFFAGFFDLFDGRVARLTRTQSEFGVQMDSLADMISFGVAPAIIMYKWALFNLDSVGLFGSFGMVGAFVFTSCGAIRLARFNVMAAEEPMAKEYFIGLPIPLAASMLIAMVLAHVKLWGDLPVERHSAILSVVLVLSYLMVSKVKYWSFKQFHFTLKWALMLIGLFLMISLVGWRDYLAVMYVALISVYVFAGICRSAYETFVKKQAS